MDNFFNRRSNYDSRSYAIRIMTYDPDLGEWDYSSAVTIGVRENTERAALEASVRFYSNKINTWPVAIVDTTMRVPDYTTKWKVLKSATRPSPEWLGNGFQKGKPFLVRL